MGRGLGMRCPESLVVAEETNHDSQDGDGVVGIARSDLDQGRGGG